MKTTLALTALLFFFVSFLFVSYSSSSADNPDAVVISVSNETIKVDASTSNNKDVIIEGSSNTIFLAGNCQSLTVKGNGNIIEMELSSSISINGSDNSISYSSGSEPSVKDKGANNIVKESLQAIESN